MTDEETFDRVFGRSDWALMFILAREGQSYARLRFNIGPRSELEIPVSVDYARPLRVVTGTRGSRSIWPASDHSIPFRQCWRCRRRASDRRLKKNPPQTGTRSGSTTPKMTTT